MKKFENLSNDELRTLLSKSLDFSDDYTDRIGLLLLASLIKEETDNSVLCVVDKNSRAVKYTFSVKALIDQFKAIKSQQQDKTKLNNLLILINKNRMGGKNRHSTLILNDKRIITELSELTVDYLHKALLSCKNDNIDKAQAELNDILSIDKDHNSYEAIKILVRAFYEKG